MKTSKLILASLTIGIMAASCQNGLEEVVEPSAVQNELASTRAIINSFVNGDIIPYNGSESELLDYVSSYAQGPAIIGNYIIGDDDENEYYISTNSYSIDSVRFSYDTSKFTLVQKTATGIKIKLTDPDSTTDATIVAYIYYNGSITHASYKSLGVNGPRPEDCSVRVVRSSDGVEAYPSSAVRLEANTFYYAYFTSPVTVNLSTWDFHNHATIYDYYNYVCYFKTDSQGWCFLDIYGYMTDYGVIKNLKSVTLYGQ